MANLCLFTGFIISFLHHYQQIKISNTDPIWQSNLIRNNNTISNAKPNLWLQFIFWTSNYAYLIAGSYLLGLLFCILKLIIGVINISWFKNNKNFKLDHNLTQISIQLCSKFKLIKAVSVYISDKISVPLTIGFIKPIVIFPIALINQLSIEQTEAILLHELAHIKRNDYLLNILLYIVQSFLFFNPAIWLMRREINKYREQCCDDLVLKNIPYQLDYARALLLIEQNRSETLNLALTSNGKKYTLLNRIKRITNMKTNEPLPQNKLVVLLLALVTIGLTVAWNFPVKRVIKHITNQHYKVIKEVQDSSRIEQFTAVSHTTSISLKKTKLPNNKKGTQFFDNIKADTIIRSKNKFKIVLEDSVGNKKEYNSVEELPAEDQKESLNGNVNPNTFKDVSFSLKFPDSTKYTYHSKYINSADLHRQANEMALIVKKQIDNYKKHIDNSPEWKEQTKKLHEEMNTPESKRMLQKVHEEANSLEVKKLIESLRKQSESQEFKKQMEKLHSETFQNKAVNEKMLKFYQSPEWKTQQKKIKKEIEKAQREWRKNYDKQREFKLPENIIKPQF